MTMRDSKAVLRRETMMRLGTAMKTCIFEEDIEDENCILIREKGEEPTQRIYIQNIMTRRQLGEPWQTIVQDAMLAHNSCRELSETDHNWEKIKDKLSLQLRGDFELPKAAEKIHLVYYPSPFHKLKLYLAIDMPASLMFVNSIHLKKWDKSPEEVYEIAFRQVKSYLPEWQHEVHNGMDLWMGYNTLGYACTSIAVEEWVRKAGVDPDTLMVAVPCRDIALMSTPRNPREVIIFKALVSAYFSSSYHTITNAIFNYRDRKRQ